MTRRRMHPAEDTCVLHANLPEASPRSQPAARLRVSPPTSPPPATREVVTLVPLTPLTLVPLPPLLTLVPLVPPLLLVAFAPVVALASMVALAVTLQEVVTLVALAAEEAHGKGGLRNAVPALGREQRWVWVATREVGVSCEDERGRLKGRTRRGIGYRVSDCARGGGFERG